MILRRGPVLPSPRMFLTVNTLAGVSLGTAMGIGLGVTWQGWKHPLWILLTALTYLLSATSVVFLHGLKRAGWDFERPSFLNWAVYFGAIAAFASAASSLRWGIMLRLFDLRAIMPHELTVLVGPVLGLGLLAAILEQETAFRQEARRQEAMLQAEVDRLFLSRAALIKARTRRTYEVLSLLEERVEPRLDASQREIERLLASLSAGKALTRDEVQAAQDALDALNEDGIRKLSHHLHPSIVDIGLVPAIRSLAQRYEGGFAVRLDVSEAMTAADDPVHNAFPPSLRLTAYRILEGALDNAARHAGAREVRIGLQYEAGYLGLSIQDDGVGFVRSHQEGVGLAAIESRVILAGGTWTLETAPGAGTRVAIALPVPQTESARR
ncbi:hypothetical protein J7643_01585 [bacterium]|nr:hypothetical protein [bacterium]